VRADVQFNGMQLICEVVQRKEFQNIPVIGTCTASLMDATFTTSAFSSALGGFWEPQKL
jgi:hypothetical protein